MKRMKEMTMDKTLRKDFTISASVAPKYLIKDKMKETEEYPITEKPMIIGTTCVYCMECAIAGPKPPEAINGIKP